MQCTTREALDAVHPKRIYYNAEQLYARQRDLVH
jgi:hypothetical protein